MMSLYFGY